MRQKNAEHRIEKPKNNFKPMHTSSGAVRGFNPGIPEAPPITPSASTPDYIRAVLEGDDHQVSGDFSVTQLLEPPRCILLRLRHPELRLQDPASLVSCTAGKAMHLLFAQQLGAQGFTTEDRILIPIPELQASVSGTVDAYRLTGDGCLVLDLKHKKTYEWEYRKFDRLVWQLNMYYYGLALRHPEITGKTSLQGVYFFTDWNRMARAKAHGNYPEKQVMTITTAPLPIPRIHQFILERLRSLQDLKGRPESEWPDPDPGDVYQLPPVLRVWKANGGRAVNGGVFDAGDYASFADAMAAAAARREEMAGKCPADVFEIRVDRHERRRCSTYCPVASECSTYQASLEHSARQKPGAQQALAALIPPAPAALRPEDVERGKVSLAEYLGQ
jgi:hypothetical protein